MSVTTDREPTAELDPQFSSPDATATPWTDARRCLEKAEVYWLSSVRPSGRPHVTPMVAVWLDRALYFCTGPEERKAKNLEGNPRCVVTTGQDALDGLDVVIEGDAERVTEPAKLQRVADAYTSKYDEPFRFIVRDAAFLNGAGGEALVYEVAPLKAFGFGKGKSFSQTRWRF